ncbi:NTE family protein [Alloalcanivorax xenomutans]|uniref:patatin-like phospholipase family protein n=1 Tax=Alcanivoracaceae TaxID=224372 RepID=UPI000BD45D57|nr:MULTISPECIES: patatin-like phospholipase family protein [Alcanivoracaceae]SOC18284.1 NTE family protein [Alloalcanivorax xenomutans]
MPPARSSSPRRALVLGCGGVAGGAWSVAVLHHLEQQSGWDVRDAAVLMGTSVGAVLAAQLGGGRSVEQLLACQQQRSSGCQWDHDRDAGGALPPLPAPGLNNPALAMLALRGRVPALTGLCGLLPRGRLDMAPFRRLSEEVQTPDGWVPHPATWIIAADSTSGRRVAFGRDDAPRATLSDAVCASYGVPGWCPPVKIGSRHYLDGGIVSPTSADLLLDRNVDEVILLAPMASRHPGRPGNALERLERRLRRYMTTRVDQEEAALKQRGKKVVRLEPGPEDLAAFGYNMMDPRRRRQILETALRTGAPLVRQGLAVLR